MRTTTSKPRSNHGWGPRAGALAALLVLALAPFTVHAAPPAQEGTVDPAILAAVQTSAERVLASVGLGGVAVPITEEPVVEEPVVEEPVVEEPIGEVVLEEPVVITSETGISLAAPANWVVDTGGGSAPFTISDVSIGLDGQVQDFGDDFPGLIAFPIFEGQAAALVESLGDETTLTSVSRMELAQGVPGLRLGFAGGDNDGEPIDGVIYIFTPGSSAYGFFIGSKPEAWPQVEAAVDAVAQSITFAPEQLSMLHAGDEPLKVDEPEGTYSLMLPPGWMASTTQDETLRLVVADPDIRIVGATVAETNVENSDELTMLTEALAGSLDDEDAASLLEGIVGLLDLTSDDVDIDPTQTAVIPSEGDSLGIIRLVGSAPIDGGPTLPITLYIAVYSDKVAAIVFFGDTAEVIAHEEAITGLLDSVEFTE